MGLSYDPGARKWNLGYEKTDHNTARPETQSFQITLLSSQPNVSTGTRGQAVTTPKYKTINVVIDPNTSVDDAIGKAINDAISSGTLESSYTVTTGAGKGPSSTNTIGISWTPLAEEKQKLSSALEDIKNNVELNKSSQELNVLNQQKNNAYDKVQQVTASTQGGDYVSQRNIIRNIQGIDNTLKGTLENYYKAYYTNEKLQPWNTNLGAKPPFGEFDASYYKQQNPEVSQQWAAAVADDNVDITQRYGENGFYLNHYTNQGKPAGFRGNKAEELAASKQYVEQKPTDKDLQDVRNIQLGLDTDTQTKRLLNVPEVASAWEAAKSGDNYWKDLGKKYFLDPNKEDEFAVLFRMSDRPEDKAISFQYNINADYGITELEDALNQAVGEKAIVDVKRFGALAQDVLKQTITEMKKAKAKEQELALFSNFDSLGEITNINKDLANSIMGDTGIGGMLSFMGGKKSQESLEKSLQKITGVNNEVTYNWQQWFDNTLKTKYQEDIELGLTKDQAEERVKVQGQFARDFIDQYLIPRFNESKSMNEFVEYIDVGKSEQNPFQTQDILNAVKLVADLRAQQYIDQLKETPERYFDSAFYFNPTGDKAREEKYVNQASTVNADWEAAKKGDPYWTSQAYRFGVNINDKDAFARMHFQVKGQGQGYDAADDILNASKVSDEIYSKILPALKEEALKQGTIFGQFLKPEEFADEMLKGLNPNDKTTWEDVLSHYNLKDFSGDITDLKKQITETLRTSSAQDIRDQIKFLNEKKEKPTQQLLGVTYIQREEDYKPVKSTGEETQLYKTFQSAGFQGTEDEFYENFFPDLDRSEQAALTKAGTSQSFKATGLDYSDPFASLGTIENFFGEDETKTGSTKTTTQAPTKSSYFTISEDEDLPAKSKAGQGFLDEFTSLFKGLS
jgi:hypothetical protein